MAGCLCKSGLQLLPVIRLAHSLGRACVGGFDKYRIGEAAFNAVYHLVHILKLLLHHRHIGRLPDPQLIYNDLCIKLIHGNSGCQYSAAHIRYLCQLQKSLDRAVLSAKAMKNREYHIQLHLCHCPILHKQGALLLCIRKDCSRNRSLSPGLIPDCLDRVHLQPLSLLCNSDQNQVIFICIDTVNHIGSRHTGHNVLRRLPAENNRCCFLFHRHFHSYSIFLPHRAYTV